MKYIDLTLVYDESIAGYESKPAKLLDKDGWNALDLFIYSHAGTHMDAPIHFGVNHETIDHISLERLFISKAWIVDLTNVGPSHLIIKADVEFQLRHFSKGDSILIKTNWYKKIGTSAYRNGLPRISEELAHWLVEIGTNLLGVEPPSVADVNNLEEVTLIHQILLKDVVIVEGLCYMDQIQSHCVGLVALPLKIKNGDGAPCRVIAIENS